MDTGPDAHAMSGQAAGVRNNGTVGECVRKMQWVHFLFPSKRGIMKYTVCVPHGTCNYVCTPDSLLSEILSQEQKNMI